MQGNNKTMMFCPYISKNAFSYLEDIMKGRWIGQGHKVSDFEDKFRLMFKVPFAVAVNEVSSAIH